MEKISKLRAAAMVAAGLFITMSTKAQTVPVNAFRFNAGIESGVTTEAIGGSPHAYFGTTGQLSYGRSKGLVLTLSSGYYYFPGNDYVRSMSMVPVKLGLKYFVAGGFYLSAEAGVGIELQDHDVFKHSDPGRGTGRSTKLLVSPGIGYAIKWWDFSVRYENFSCGHKDYLGRGINYGLVGLRIAYSFGK